MYHGRMFALGMLLLGAVSFTPIAAQAQTTSTVTLQAQIEQLLRVINQLQQQLAVRQNTMLQCQLDLTRDLSFGMRGQDVQSLQRFLNQDPATRVAVAGAGSLGNETDYYGPLTQQAVSRFQLLYRAETLEPTGRLQPTGVVSRYTRMQMHRICTQRNQIQTPTTPSTPPTSPTTPSTPVVVGVEGDITVERGLDRVNTLEMGETDTIYAIEVRAYDSPMTIERIDLVFDKEPWRYLDSISIRQDDDRVKQVDVEEDGVREINDEYRLRINNVDAVVEADTKSIFTFVATALDSISRSRENDSLSVYVPEDGVRAQDTTGFRTEEPGSDLAARSFDFRDPEDDGILTVARSSDSPDSQLIEVRSTATTPDVPFLLARVRAKESDIALQNAVLVLESDHADITDIVRDVSVEWNGQTIDTADVRGNTGSAIMATDEDGNEYTLVAAGEYYVEFEDLEDITIDEDDTEELSIVADISQANNRYPSETTLTFTLRSLEGENEHGEDVVAGDMNVGSAQVFTLVAEGISAATDRIDADTSGSRDQIGSFEIGFSVTPFGNDIYLPITASQRVDETTTGTGGVEYVIQTGDRSIYAGSGVSAVFAVDDAREVADHYRLNEGVTYDLTVNVSFDNSEKEAGFYRAKIAALRYRIGATTAPIQTVETGLRDLVTNMIFIED